MRRFWHRLRVRLSPRPQSAGRLTHRPRLEALEDRQLLSVSAAAFNNGVFIRYNNSDLFLHDSTGFHRIDTNVTSVSAGISFRLPGAFVNAAFILYNNGQVFEWTQDHGFQFIDSNAVALVASRGNSDSVFILYNNSELFHHVGTSPATGFTFIAGNVTSMSLTFGAGDVFYVQTNHILSEHLAAGGSTVIDGNVQSVSGGQVETDSAFVVYTNAALFLFNPHAMQHFTPVDSNVASVATSESTIPGTMTLTDAAFYVTRDGVLVEWVAPNAASPSPDGTYSFVDANVASISTLPQQPDDVFIVYTNDMLFQHTGLSRRSGFTFIDSNVSP
jgi:hypothetical protein